MKPSEARNRGYADQPGEENKNSRKTNLVEEDTVHENSIILPAKERNCGVIEPYDGRAGQNPDDQFLLTDIKIGRRR